MQYLTRWAGTTLPNTNLGQTGIINAESLQINNVPPHVYNQQAKKSDIRK